MPAIPPTMPPTMVPALDDDFSGADVGVAEPEGEDVAEVALPEAESVEDAAVEDAVAEDASDVTDVEVGLVVTTFPFTTHLPSFLLQQLGPFCPFGSPQHKLPSAQVVKGIHTPELLLPKSSVYPSCLSTVTRLQTCQSTNLFQSYTNSGRLGPSMSYPCRCHGKQRCCPRGYKGHRYDIHPRSRMQY